MTSARRLGVALILSLPLLVGWGFPGHRSATREGGSPGITALAAAQPAPTQSAPANTWNFDDEDEAAPTWMDDIRDQWVDIALVCAFCVLAFVSFFKKSRALKYVTLVVSVAYLGFYKSQLLSVVNIFGVLGNNLPRVRYSLAWYLFAIVGVASTVLWGRVYCGRICAFGAFTQLLDRIVPKRFQVEVPLRIERRASLIKYVILAVAVGTYLWTRNPGFYPYIEPFWMFGLTGKTPVLGAMLAALLILTIFVRNAYCRFLCPLGAALGLISKLTVFRIKRWSECSTCRICEKACEWGAIQGPRIIMTECVRCDDCERLYADEKKCPHHRIIFYRNRQALNVPDLR